MKISEVARAAGLTAKTVRFYEEEGLLPDPPRTPSGYRVYTKMDQERLAFIRQAKRLGLTLRDIRGILQLHDREEATCVHVRSLLEEKLDHVETVIRDLESFRTELARLRDAAGSLEDCRPSGGRICGIIERSGIGVSNAILVRLEDWQGGRR